MVENFAQRVIDLFGSVTSPVVATWEPTEGAVGVRLPRDYKELVGRIGAVIIDDWLCLFGPDVTNANSSIARVVEERELAWSTLREAGVELEESYLSSGSRLLAFASIEATYFYWHAAPGVPADSWGVVIVDDDMENWYEIEVSATECIYRVMTGSLRLPSFDDLFGDGEHRADPILSSS